MAPTRRDSPEPGQRPSPTRKAGERVEKLPETFSVRHLFCRRGVRRDTGDPDCDMIDQDSDGEVNPRDAGFILARFGDCE